MIEYVVTFETVDGKRYWNRVEDYVNAVDFAKQRVRAGNKNVAVCEIKHRAEVAVELSGDNK
jgi:hypothetical protein